MTEDPSVKDVLSAAVNIPKKAGQALLGAKVPVKGLQRFGRAVATQWLALVLLTALFLWVFVDHLAMVEEVKNLRFAREHPPIENTAKPTTASPKHTSALHSFDELEAANPANRSLGFNPAARSVATTEEEFAAERARAAAVAERSVIGAAFQNENMIGSLFSKQADVMSNVDKGDDFDIVKYIDDNNLRGYEDEFMGVLNKDYADALLSDLQRKQRNDETLAAAGWAGVLAVLAASLFDLPGIVLIGAFLWGRRPYAGPAGA
ncbi:MAG: hypothetical protein C0524_06115 [Rhodobacter sp.]|nr:hypothetical protein [Rhodobacter sp.]